MLYVITFFITFVLSKIQLQMKSKTITLAPEGLHQFYRQYIELLNPILELSNRQLDTLGVLLYYNHDLSLAFSNPGNPLKWATLFSAKSRKEMASEIKMTKMNFNNNMKSLRDKGIISFDDIRSDILLDPYEIKKEFLLNFKFKIKTDEDSEN